MSAFQAPTGTRDVLPPESALFEAIVARFAVAARLAGYGLVVSPMFEDVAVFQRGVGEASEVVTKEMYVFEDKGGRTLALRPEGTASVVRAYLQHRPQLPWKAWYVTPAFRYERPQAGRYRQHHQVGVEALGVADPDLDVEVIALLAGFYADLGLTKVELRVNSMGDADCLPAYKDALREFLRLNATSLCDEHRARWQDNPLRVLDCKKDPCRGVREGAPRLPDALCEPCRAHLDRVLAGLDALGIVWERDDFLVRGFDYYTRTTFEFASSALDAAQNAIGGGGRYDRLVEALGGPATPGVGFGCGIERLLLAQAAEAVDGADDPLLPALDAFVVDLVGGDAGRDITAELRCSGLAADRSFDGRSLKSQLRQADRSGARLALIVGADEAAADVVTVRWLREETGGVVAGGVVAGGVVAGDAVGGGSVTDADGRSRGRGPAAGRQERIDRSALAATLVAWLR